MYVGLFGYTDNIGNHNFNMKLARERTEAVKSYLLSVGISEKRVKFKKAYGSSRPIDDDRKKAGRIKNRRVEINMNYAEYL